MDDFGKIFDMKVSMRERIFMACENLQAFKKANHKPIVLEGMPKDIDIMETLYLDKDLMSVLAFGEFMPSPTHNLWFKIYRKQWEDCKLIEDLANFYSVVRCMYELNCLLMPSFNGQQYGNLYMQKMLARHVVKTMNDKIKGRKQL